MTRVPPGEPRVLFVGDANDVYVQSLATELRKSTGCSTVLVHTSPKRPSDDARNALREVIDPYEAWFVPRLWIVGSLWASWTAAWTAWRSRRRTTAVGFMYVDVGALIALVLLAGAATRKVATMYGSDFYRAPRWVRFAQSIVLRRADVVTFTNPATEAAYRTAMRPRAGQRLLTARFGLPLLPLIDEARPRRDDVRRRLGVQDGAVVLACGFNGSPAQRHAAMLDAAASLSDAARARLFLLVQMSYGVPSPAYLAEVEDRLARIGVPFKLVTSFLAPSDVADLRVAADVLVHVQPTDQFSGSMQECLYAGARVVTGAWLPYEELARHGVALSRVESLDGLSAEIERVVLDRGDRSEERRRNADAVRALSSWPNCVARWRDAYGLAEASAV